MAVELILAPNPGPMTLEGTNTYLYSAPEGVFVIDPGPLDEGHLQRIIAQASGEISTILVTHGHADHVDGAERLSELTRAFVFSYGKALFGGYVGGGALRGYGKKPRIDTSHRKAESYLPQGDSGDVYDRIGPFDVHHLPGHTADSIVFHDPEAGELFVGDTVLGRGTTVIAYPDGSLGDYLESLRRLRELVTRFDIRRIRPGHGPVVDNPLEVLDYYIAHRRERLEQVRAAVAAGASTPREVVERVYADVDPALWPAAELSVRAQLEYLGTMPDD